MSLETPNKNETLIENYAAAVRRYNKAKLAVEAATRELEAAQTHRQSAWGFVKEEIGTQQGKIQPGVYRLQTTERASRLFGTVSDV